MNELKLFIWEGDGISDAYHDDGTLVVLANSPEEAREIMRQKRQQIKAHGLKIMSRRDELVKQGVPNWPDAWKQAEAELGENEYESSVWDGSDNALDREPDRVLELDKPKFVAFNGGGYD